jgi:predicted nucleotidyltransferase
MRPPAEEAARTLVTERYPDAVQAWLAGSVSRGEGTPTSDLDITVLLDEVEVHRETVEYAGWPAELFVHTAASIEFFVAKDLARRHPTMARLVATGIPLLGEGGADVRRHCAEALERGPGPVSDADLEVMRYGLTDLLDDLADVRPGPETTATAVGVWRAAAELTLAAGATWNGTGKWLARELGSLDERRGTQVAAELDEALRRALDGDPDELAAVAGAVLEGCGGRFHAGLHLVADLPEP